MPAQNGGEIFPKFRIFLLPIGKIFEAHAQIFQDVFLQPDQFFCACDPQNLWVWKGWPKVFFCCDSGQLEQFDAQSVRRLECLLEVCYHFLVSSLVWIYGDLFLPSEVYLHPGPPRCRFPDSDLGLQSEEASRLSSQFRPTSDPHGQKKTFPAVKIRGGKFGR